MVTGIVSLVRVGSGSLWSWCYHVNATHPSRLHCPGLINPAGENYGQGRRVWGGRAGELWIWEQKCYSHRTCRLSLVGGGNPKNGHVSAVEQWMLLQSLSFLYHCPGPTLLCINWDDINRCAAPSESQVSQWFSTSSRNLRHAPTEGNGSFSFPWVPVLLGHF